MSCWLLKTEPDEYSIDDLAKDKSTCWGNVRNYQARNYLREMKVGDSILFYHSEGTPSGIAGVAKVAKAAYADPSQFDKKSDYFDPKATKETPRWFAPDIKFEKKFKALLATPDLRKEKALEKMVLFQRGSRLSVQPVSESEFKHILKLAGL